MNKNYFLKKKILPALTYIGLLMLHICVRTCKFLFAKRTILFVTNQKIRSIRLGPISQICIIIAFAWIFNLFNQSLNYNHIISSKSDEIGNLQSSNTYFQEELRDINDKLKKINDYLISATGSSQKVSGEEKFNFKTPKNIKEKDLSKDDQNTLNEIKNANEMLVSVHHFARHRIKTIENAINITGLNLKQRPSHLKNKFNNSDEKEISLNEAKGIKDRQGGPLVDLDSIADNTGSEDEIQKHLKKAEFSNDFDRLAMLENLIKVMPLSKPMKSYYISSGFGRRTDPITGRHASHQGLDFVGPEHGAVISPSDGKVILAGKFSDYGNAVVINHGFGITTRYGHLAAVKVTQGQIVKKGQLIAIQGNTGRSTGSHLHYEVRYRNTPLNPKKFLEAGDSLFNDETNIKYVNS
ncbi:MAG: M23 family metallopeptidase [Proteobacteria bacterium]|nr:M23 family metallopeptidase [Pseudomonadota bacterium]